MTFRERMQHAFAVDDASDTRPAVEQQPVVDRICREVARRHLTTPSLIALELFRPLNYVTSMFMHAVSPMVWAIARRESHENYNHFAAFLEKRGSIEYLAARVEHFEHEYERRAKGETSSADDATGADHGDEESS